MAHIVGFTISQLAGRDGDYSVSLDDRVNVFFGNNGSGKTSLLKILHAALADTTGGLLSVPFVRAEVKIHSEVHDATFTRVFDKTAILEYQEYTKLGNDRGLRRPELALGRLAEIEKSVAWSGDKEMRVEGIPHSYLPTTRLYAGFDPYASREFDPRRPVIPESALESNFAMRLDSIWQQYYVNISRRVSRVQAAGLASILKLVLASATKQEDPRPEVDPITAYKSVAAFLQRQGSPGILGTEEDFSWRYGNVKAFREVVSDICSVEQQINEIIRPKNKLQALINKLITGRKSISLDENTITVETLDHKPLGLVSLSSGEKQVLRILLEALLAGANTMIVDEPELSMHIDWQRELVGSLRELNPDCQLILATHSPEVMVGVDDAQIHKL